jgi:hypothetical protein
MLRTEASMLICLSVGLQNNLCYEQALSSKQDLLSMRGVGISPQQKEKEKKKSKQGARARCRVLISVVLKYHGNMMI